MCMERCMRCVLGINRVVATGSWLQRPRSRGTMETTASVPKSLCYAGFWAAAQGAWQKVPGQRGDVKDSEQLLINLEAAPLFTHRDSVSAQVVSAIGEGPRKGEGIATHYRNTNKDGGYIGAGLLSETKGLCHGWPTSLGEVLLMYIICQGC